MTSYCVYKIQAKENNPEFEYHDVSRIEVHLCFLQVECLKSPEITELTLDHINNPHGILPHFYGFWHIRQSSVSFSVGTIVTGVYADNTSSTLYQMIFFLEVWLWKINLKKQQISIDLNCVFTSCFFILILSILF